MQVAPTIARVALRRCERSQLLARVSRTARSRNPVGKLAGETLAEWCPCRGAGLEGRCSENTRRGSRPARWQVSRLPSDYPTPQIAERLHYRADACLG